MPNKGIDHARNALPQVLAACSPEVVQVYEAGYPPAPSSAPLAGRPGGRPLARAPPYMARRAAA
jgi:hypothetical protein